MAWRLRGVSNPTASFAELPIAGERDADERATGGQQQRRLWLPRPMAMAKKFAIAAGDHAPGVAQQRHHRMPPR